MSAWKIPNVAAVSEDCWLKMMAPILESALEAVQPDLAVARWVQREGQWFHVSDQRYDLSKIKRVLVVGGGKAGLPMAQKIYELLGDRITAGLVIVKEGYAGSVRQVGPIEIIEAGHPVPDARGIQGSERILALLQGTSSDDLIIGLISGGASAILNAPGGMLSLPDIQKTTAALLGCGASIHQFNAVRKHLDQIKGGGLARRAAPARVVGLILSDVVGDRLEVIGSGPTVADPSTYQDAIRILESFNLIDLGEIPGGVVAYLKAGAAGAFPETLKPGDPVASRVKNVIIGNNRQAAEAALHQALACGLNAQICTTSLQGEASQAGQFLASIAQEVALFNQPVARPGCLIFGGETTVTLTEHGLGGRNQELALGAVQALAGLPTVALLTFATDGGDGPTDAAGAVVTGETCERAASLNMDASQFLRAHNSYQFFKTLGDLVFTGPTRTNVNDLAFVFAY